MKKFDCHSQYEAAKKLKELEITFDRCITLSKDQHPYYGYWHSYEKSNLHFYFMLGNKDVAYYTKFVNCLTIQDDPREWDKEFLDKTEIVTILES